MTNHQKQDPEKTASPKGNLDPVSPNYVVSTPQGRRNFVRTALVLGLSLVLTGSAGYFLLREQNGNGKEQGSGIFTVRDRQAIRQNIQQIGRAFDQELAGTWTETKKDFKEIQRQFETAFQEAAERFAREKLTRTNILSLVYQMAQDHLDDGNRTDRWFESNLEPHITPAIERYEASQNTVLNRFETEVFLTMDNRRRDLRQNLSEVPEVHRAGVEFEVDREAVRLRLRQAIEEPSLAGARSTSGGVVTTGGGLTLVAAGTLAQRLTGIVRQSLNRVMRPVVVRVAARIAAAPVAAVPVVGWVVAGGGALWTGFDLYRLDARTRSAFDEGLREVLLETRTGMGEFTESLEAFLRTIEEEKSREDEHLLASL